MPFELDNDFDSGVDIRVIGVGGGGTNAVNRMISSNIKGVHKLYKAIKSDTAKVVHSEKGNALLEGVTDAITITECDALDAVKYNSAAVMSVKSHKKRSEFLEHVTAENFEVLLNKCLKKNVFQKIKAKVKNAFIKISRIRKSIN